MPWERLIILRELGGGAARGGSEGWTPEVDVVETEGAFIVVAELPGLRESDFALEVTAYQLTLRGERRPQASSCDAYIQLERPSGLFRRRFSFPVPVEVDEVTAEFVTGVLTVTVPKSGADRRRIDVS